MKIKNLIQTCFACPSQWEAKTEDGRGVYIRYRWGHLTIHMSDKIGQHGLDGTEIYSNQLGDEIDGLLDWDKVAPIIEQL